MLRNIFFHLLCMIVTVGSNSIAFGVSLSESDASTTVATLDLPYRAKYITSCSSRGNRLKDIVVADENNITVFFQKPNRSFTKQTINISDTVTALNAFRCDLNSKEYIICQGHDKLFYFALENGKTMDGPHYVEIPKNMPTFVLKQRNMDNFLFSVDMDSNGLDDLVLPSEEGPLIFRQNMPLTFKIEIVSGWEVNRISHTNSRLWPICGDKTDSNKDGVSFFPSFEENQNFWFQDYDRDGLLDIISGQSYTDGYTLFIYLQGDDKQFETLKKIYIRNNASRRSCENLRMLDLDGDGYLDLVEVSMEPTLTGSNSLLPMVALRMYFAASLYDFEHTSKNIIKSMFFPGLDNVADIDSDGRYEIIAAPSSLNLGSKEALLRLASDRELFFSLGYFVLDKDNRYSRYVRFDKEFSVLLPGLNEIDKFHQFLRVEDINGDQLSEVLLLKKPSLLEIDTLVRKRGDLCINKCTYVNLPCFATAINFEDIDGDGMKELLVLDASGKKIYVLFLKDL